MERQNECEYVRDEYVKKEVFAVAAADGTVAVVVVAAGKVFEVVAVVAAVHIGDGIVE